MRRNAIPPEQYRIKLFTRERLGGARPLGTLLDLLHRHGLDPTHADYELPTKGRFDREALMAAVTGGRQRIVVLARRKAPTATIVTHAQSSGLTAIGIELAGTLADAELPYRLGDDLAAAFAVEHGVVHPSYPGKWDFNAAGSIELHMLQEFGPLWPAARTWYGPHMLGLLGPALARAGGEQVKTPWGAVRVDLMPTPWTAAYGTLVKRQAELQKALAGTGIFGDYRHPIRHRRGPRWTPIPDVA